jgi:tetratricopeptide (TPR) repeat protein
MKYFCTTLILLFCSSLAGFSHGDMHLQIQEVTRDLEKQPRNAALYLKRGEVFRAHGDFDSAHADLERAALLEPRMEVLPLARGRLFYEANWPQSAKMALDSFLRNHTNHVEALALRARCLVKMGQRLDGVKDYTRAIEFAADPQPELYLERAQALNDEGPVHYAEAVKGLEDGMKKMGPLVTLQLYAIDLEVKEKKYDAALARLDNASAASPRKETWLARKGEILQTAGRPDQACDAFRSALKAISQLPDTRRNVPAMQELQKRLNAVLEAISKDQKSEKKSF